MADETGAVDKAALLAEAYKRDLLPPPQKAAYEEALRRGIVSVGADKPVDYVNEANAAIGGLNRGVAATLGAPVDLLNAGLSVVGLGTEKPVGGSEWFKDRFGNVIDVGDTLAGNNRRTLSGLITGEHYPTGREQIDTQAQTPGGRVLARGLEEVAGAAVPMAGAMAVPGRVLGPVAGAVRESLAGVNNLDRASQLGIAATSGVGAGVAHEVAPDSRLAELAGGLVGGAVGAGAHYAGGQLVNAAAPLLNEGSRQAVAGQIIRRMYSPDEQYLQHLIDQGVPREQASRLAREMADRAAGVDIATAPREIVPGSELTTAQAVQDSGLAGLERTLRADPVAGPRFANRDAQRAAAQRDAINAQAPGVEGAEAVAAAARDRLQRFQRETDIRATVGQDDVNQRLGQLGPGADPVAAGQTVRGELGAARADAKTGERALWGQLRANPDLALEVSAVQETAARLRGEIGPYTAPPAGDTSAILEAAASVPAVARYQDLQDLASWAKRAESEFRRAGNEIDARRVGSIRAAIDADVARAAGAAEDAGGAAAGTANGPAPAGGAGGVEAPRGSGRVYTPSGQAIDTRFEVVDLAGPNAPVVSHTADFRENPAFPQELQPRDRSRAADQARVVNISNTLNPERLGAGGVGEGAPIIGPDGITESGNGRLMALQRAYAASGRPAAEYRQWLESQGYDTRGMTAPVLVRRRTNDLSPEQRRGFVEEANAGPGARLSPVEQAGVDAGRLTDDDLSLYRGGALDDAANRDFVRAFVGRLGANEGAGLATAGGTLSVEGQRRLAHALAARAYGADSALVSSLLETGDDNIKALGRALVDAAPGVAQLKAAIAAGDVPKDFDPTATLLDAARVVQRARAAGVPIGDVLAQQDAFNPINRHTADFLAAAYGDGYKRVSYGRASEALRTYISDALQQDGGGGLFGGGPSAADVWAAARRRAGGVADDAPAAGAGPAAAPEAVPPGARPGSGESVPPGSGSDNIVGSGLVPNFGPDEAALYSAARNATRERAETFDRGAPGRVLQKGGYQARDGEYAMPVERVAGTFFNKGSSAATDVAEFVRAAGDRPAAVQALRDYAVDDLRRTAIDEGGKLKGAAWAKWVRDHYQALGAFPELRAELNTIGKAQAVVDRVAERRAAGEAGYRASAAGKFLDNDARPALASALASGNRTANLRQLVRTMRGQPGGVEALRRGVIDEFLGRITNTGGMDAAGEATLSGAKTTGWLAQNAEALQKSGLFSADHIAALRAVEADMDRMKYVNSAGRAIGSNTYQNLATGVFIEQLGLGVAANNPIAQTLLRPLSWLNKLPEARVRELVTDAMLDPKFAAVLAGKASPDRIKWVSAMLKRRAGAEALNLGVQTMAPDEPRAAAAR